MLLMLLGHQLIKYKFNMSCTTEDIKFLLHWNFTVHARDESAHAHNVKCRSKSQPSLLFAGCLALNFTCSSRLEPLPGLLVNFRLSECDNGQPDVLPL